MQTPSEIEKFRQDLLQIRAIVSSTKRLDLLTTLDQLIDITEPKQAKQLRLPFPPRVKK